MRPFQANRLPFSARTACATRKSLFALAALFVASLCCTKIARAEDSPPKPHGDETRDRLAGFEQWLSNASCVKCHFHVPQQTANGLTYLHKLVEQGYATEQSYGDALKRAQQGHAHAQHCADCHESATEVHGECVRDFACWRNAGVQRKETYLGVSVVAVPAAVRQHVKLPDNVGLMVESVEPDSPAAEAELRKYDLLEKLDRQLLVNQGQFSVLIKRHRPGEEILLEVIRGNEPKTLSIKLGERELADAETSTTAFALAALAAGHTDSAVAGGMRFLELAQAQAAAGDVTSASAERLAEGPEAEQVVYLGIHASPPPAALVEQLKLPKDLYLVIDAVEPDSPAAAAGLRPFDVLQKLDDQLLVNAEQLTVLIRNHSASDEVELTLIRDGKPLKLRATLGEHQIAHAMKEQQAENDRILAAARVMMTELELKDVANAELADAVDLALTREVNDEEYVRRVYVDLLGAPPSPNEVQEFMSDGSPNKRQRLIDRLLSRPDVIAKLRDRAVLEWSDGEHSLVLTTGNAGQKRLLAKEKEGNVLFDGPVETEEQRQQLGPRLAAKLELMLKSLTVGPALEAPADAGAALEKTLPHFQADDETLLQLLDRLSRETGANIVVDRKALLAAGVTLDDPLSLDLHDVRGLTVLKMLLTLASGGKDRLTFELDEGVALITATRSSSR